MRCPSLTELPSPPPNKVGWSWTEESQQLPDQMSDGSEWPKISIVTPSYNQGKFIEETIRSVLLQGYPNLEYIIIDGGSTDQSVDIIKKYEKWLSYWLSEPDRGQSNAINKGFSQASGEILAWLNSDDYYLKDALHQVATQFIKQPVNVGAVVGIGHKINLRKEVIYTPTISDLNYDTFLQWLNDGNFMQPSAFFRKQAWEKCGPLCEDLKYPMDVDLFLKIAKNYQFKRINQSLSHAYAHETAKTTGERIFCRAETIWLISQSEGGSAISRNQIMQFAQEYYTLKSKVDRVQTSTLFRLLYPLIRIFFKELFNQPLKLFPKITYADSFNSRYKDIK